jgi:hypothetical protein
LGYPDEPFTVFSLAVSGTNLFAGTSGAGVFLSTNNGTSWTAATTGLGNTAVPSLAVSGTNLFSGTQGHGIFFSTNNGTSWSAVNTGLPFYSAGTTYDITSFAVYGMNLFAGTLGGVFLSTNNGTNWTAVNTGLTNNDVNTLAVSGTNLFAGTLGGVFLSTNNGTNWTAVNTGLTNNQIATFAVSGNNIFVGTHGNGVLMKPLNEILPVELVSFNVTFGDKIVTISWSTATEVNNYGFEIERRFFGETQQKWAKIAFIEGAGSSSSPKQYSYTDQHLSAGRYAYRLKQIDSDGSFKYSMSVEVEVNFRPTAFSLAQNFPNPFNPSTTISFDLPSQSFVSLKIFDLIGREVATIVSEELSAGSHSRQWNATGMPSGVYFYRLQAGSFTGTKKLLLLK